MKILSHILLIFSMLLILIGVYFDLIAQNQSLQDKFYGAGSLLFFFVTIPIFLISRRNSKSWEKYRWNPEEFKRQQDSK
ncbi:Uncharacterised protein [Candidatus Ornithobacterium hominis]|uniref:hypothetical protein n=1 Tax=Candidatus Ornithobacterium hominis TaxID=2497989 RepID=UPI000E8DBD32|nr:hypothetical protein [Candidatus Ornithobacterium hominis]SZD72234.1 Uncharacterised protein [Candidatus Ornithobacterium hominis]